MTRRILASASIAAAIALAAAAAPAQAATMPTTVHKSCAWTDPGADPYAGTFDAAMARYASVWTDAQRAELRAMVAHRAVTRRVTITAHDIVGEGITVAPQIRLMHTGLKGLCLDVDRSDWAPDHTEGAALYWIPGSRFALLRPDACGNWSVVEVLAIEFPVVKVERPAPRSSLVDIIRFLKHGPRTQDAALSAAAPDAQPVTLQYVPMPLPDGVRGPHSVQYLPREAPHRVPEPPTIVLAGFALVAVLAVTKRGRK